jgi:hypothetical protein
MNTKNSVLQKDSSGSPAPARDHSGTVAHGLINDLVSDAPSEATTDMERQRHIAEAAYYRAQHRGFAAGRHEEDWLEAERAVDESASRTRVSK